FIATEILIWVTLVVWVYFMVPVGKLKFLGVFAIFNLLNFALWIRIKQGIAGVFFRLAFSLKKDSYLKIDKQLVKISELKFDYVKILKNDSFEKIAYIDALKKGIIIPSITKVEVLRKNNEKIKTKDELLTVLAENGFNIDGIETRMKFFSDNENFKIYIFSFSRKKNAEIKHFIKEIF
ncbi:MAG: hypothetical protein U9Q83_06180, partial [Bacteroidota bacterium]|nr:hypothetical protein [Bacteroidota bacterium]